MVPHDLSEVLDDLKMVLGNLQEVTCVLEMVPHDLSEVLDDLKLVPDDLLEVTRNLPTGFLSKFPGIGTILGSRILHFPLVLGII